GLIPCAWGKRKCLPVQTRPSASWDGRLFPWRAPCAELWTGFGRTAMPKIAIVAALERELRPLVRSWKVEPREHAGRVFRFFERGDRVAVCGGIGAEAARRAAEAIIVLYAPEAI